MSTQTAPASAPAAPAAPPAAPAGKGKGRANSAPISYYDEADVKVIFPYGKDIKFADSFVAEKLPRVSSNVYKIFALLAKRGKKGAKVEEIAVEIYGKKERLNTVRVYFGFNIPETNSGLRVGRILSGPTKDNIVLLTRKSKGISAETIRRTFLKK